MRVRLSTAKHALLSGTESVHEQLCGLSRTNGCTERCATQLLLLLIWTAINTLSLYARRSRKLTHAQVQHVRHPRL